MPDWFVTRADLRRALMEMRKEMEKMPTTQEFTEAVTELKLLLDQERQARIAMAGRIGAQATALQQQMAALQAQVAQAAPDLTGPLQVLQDGMAEVREGIEAMAAIAPAPEAPA